MHKPDEFVVDVALDVALLDVDFVPFAAAADPGRLLLNDDDEG